MGFDDIAPYHPVAVIEPPDAMAFSSEGGLVCTFRAMASGEIRSWRESALVRLGPGAPSPVTRFLPRSCPA